MMLRKMIRNTAEARSNALMLLQNVLAVQVLVSEAFVVMACFVVLMWLQVTLAVMVWPGIGQLFWFLSLCNNARARLQTVVAIVV